MEKFLAYFEEIQASVPWDKALIAVGILLLGRILQGVFAGIVIDRIEQFTGGTETDLDDRFVAVAKQPLNGMMFLISVWAAHLVVAPYLSEDLNNKFGDVITLVAVFLFCVIIYRAAPILGELFAMMTLKTNSDLDDLLVPYLPKVFQTIAVMIFVIKASETFLGASVGALIGLLGGAGVALGLLFKDIIYDWCCAVLIYTDKLYRPGDWVVVDGVNGFAQVLSIGLRSTSLLIVDWGSIKKLPNSRMISGVVENWSQDRGRLEDWGFVTRVEIDHISAEQTERIMEAFKALVKSLKSTSNHIVAFNGIKGNARVFQIKFYINDGGLYMPHADAVHLGILKILEQEGIDNMHVFLRTDPLKSDKIGQALNN